MSCILRRGEQRLPGPTGYHCRRQSNVLARRASHPDGAVDFEGIVDVEGSEDGDETGADGAIAERSVRVVRDLGATVRPPRERPQVAG
jgi:hypothetical protein